MTVLSIFGGTYCAKDEVVDELVRAEGLTRVEDAAVVAKAAALSGLAEDKIARALSSKTSVFNRFTHEKERSVAWLKLAMAEILAEDGLLLEGFCGMLAPRTVSHVMRVCLIADIQHRLAQAKAEGLSEKDALKAIRSADEDAAEWIKTVFRGNDPWTSELYDILLPMHTKDVAGAVGMIRENMAKEAVAATPDSWLQVEDFHLAARVEVHLVGEGHDVGVSAHDGRVVLTINKNVMLLSRLEEELTEAASKVEGVRNVEVKVGSGFYQTDIYRRVDFEMPSKVLLVDDEREFVETLSERLSMRDVGSHVVYDGQSALDMVRSDEPDVMILDLKMPGIDGIEVLRRVREEKPNVEVIILTGHGSEEDRKVCMDLGAFAYLHKPVDIEVLSRTLKQAQDKIAGRTA